MAITAKMVKELRELTGAGMRECKKALTETNGNMDEAVDYLRKSCAASAAKKAGRVAAEGSTFITVEGNTAALIEVNCETDFVVKNELFQKLLVELGEHVVKNKPASIEEALGQTRSEELRVGKERGKRGESTSRKQKERKEAVAVEDTR